MAEISKDTIIMNFKSAMAQADKLDTIADRLNKLNNSEFEQILNSINANWKGECASKYLHKGDKLQEYMTDTSGSLHDIAEEIRNIARRIYNAEMAALAIAEARNV